MPHVFPPGIHQHRMTDRINVGGKLLTNHFRDLITYRHMNVTEETWLVNYVSYPAPSLSSWEHHGYPAASVDEGEGLFCCHGL